MLPPTATDVFEMNLNHPPIHQLRAKATKPEFLKFTERIGLRPILPSESFPDWVLYSNNSPWNSVGVSKPSHVLEERGRIFTIAKYEDGYLYFQFYY